MAPLKSGWRSRLSLKSMASRLYLILFAGLLLAHGLSFALLFYERYLTGNTMMLSNLERDVVTSVALLDHVAADERGQWLPSLRRRTYQYILGPGDAGGLLSERASSVARVIATALGSKYQIRSNAVSHEPERFQVHLELSDGSPLTIEITPAVMPVARWLPAVLSVQLLLLLACTWIAVRQAARPLAELARAADALSPNGDGPNLPTRGPAEVAKAMAAFNVMQARIRHHLRDRLQILAAISHDLQTPITRMRLRAEVLGESPERSKFIDDLREMEHLVRDGIAYARSADVSAEPSQVLDLDAFLDSLVLDYQDVGRSVRLTGHAHSTLSTRPIALRRVLGNLIDNALKYAGAAQVHVKRAGNGRVAIAVLDRGPGIPKNELALVVQPFYRVEGSRNRDTGGAGLGLAIAHQLVAAIGGGLTVQNRQGGGVAVVVRLTAGDA